MAEVKKIRSTFVREQAKRYLEQATIEDVVTNFIYNCDMYMFEHKYDECADDDPFDYYEQVNGKNTELREMVLNRIKELVEKG